MRLFLSLLLALLGTVAVSAQINATVYPSEAYEVEKFEDYSTGTPLFFNKSLNTGKAQRLAFSVFNTSSWLTVEIGFTCENPLDGYKEHVSFHVEPYHQSDRCEFISTGMLNYSYMWDTELTTLFNSAYEFEAYWIYQVLNLY